VRRPSAASLWRLFAGVALLQVGDLATTYTILSAGGREGNILMRTIILTPTAPVLKATALLVLAILIVSSTGRGWPAPRRLFIATQVIFAFYTVVVLNNLAVLLLPRALP
jgi:hypothetical protein